MVDTGRTREEGEVRVEGNRVGGTVCSADGFIGFEHRKANERVENYT